MEFWYKGGIDCNLAVRDRCFSISPWRPTILIGQNGSGKTLAATLYRVVREFVMSGGEDITKNLKKMTDLFTDLGLLEIGCVLDIGLLDIVNEEYSNYSKMDIHDPAMNIPRILEELDEKLVVPNLWDDPWETDYTSFSLSMKVHITFKKRGNAIQARVVAIPECFTSLEVDVSEKFEEQYPDLEGPSGASGRGIGNAISIFEQNFQAGGGPFKSIQKGVIDGLDRHHGEIQQSLIDAGEEAISNTEMELKQRIGRSLDDDSLIAIPRSEFDEISNYAIWMKICDGFPTMTAVGVDRVWTDARHDRVDRELLEMLINNRNLLCSKFGADNRNNSPTTPPLGEEFAPLNAFYDEEGYPFFYDSRSGVLQGLQKIGDIVPIAEQTRFQSPEKNKQVKETFADVFHNYIPISIEEIQSRADRIAALANNLLSHDPYRALADDFMTKGIEEEWWTVEQGGHDEFLKTYLEFSLAYRFVKWFSVETGILFQLHTELMADQGDAAIDTLIRVLSKPEHLPSGYQRLLAMVLSITKNRIENEFGEFTFEYEAPFVLFIDEPEISLHINWQVRLIDFLMAAMKLFAPQGSMLLVATHSPEVIQDHLSHCVELTLQDRA